MIIYYIITPLQIQFSPKMGTGGCLGPVKNKQQIYVKLIKQMHEEAHKISHSQSRNLDLYQAIKQKISKKGYLKKFTDNLSFHRHKVMDSLNFNYKSTVQRKQIEKHYVGLIIADAIMELIYSSNTFGETSYIQQLSSSDYENSISLFKKTQFRSKQISPTQTPHYKLQILQQYKSVYDEQYFKLIFFLFQNEKKMHLRLIESMISFCSRHPSNFNCEHYIWKSLEKLSQNIQKGLYLSQSCQLFYLLLARSKDQSTEQLRNQNMVINIIRTWLREKDNFEIDGAQIQTYCEQIIGIIFNRCIFSWDSLFLYEVIFHIYDSIEFNPKELQPFQNMYYNILKASDMKINFLRGLFNYLLGYLSITQQSSMDQLDRKWFSSSLGLSYQKMRIQYKHAIIDTVKVQALKLICQWVDKGYTDISQFCVYNCKALIFVYLENGKYYSRIKNKTMMDLIIKEYFGLIWRMTINARCMFVDRVNQQFRELKVGIDQWVIARLIKEIVYRGILVYNKNQNNQTASGDYGQHLDLYLLPIFLKYSHELRLQLLKIYGYISQNCQRIQLNQQGKNKLCEFLWSIYQNIASDEYVPNSINIGPVEKLKCKLQFVCAIISVFRNFIHYVSQNEYNGNKQSIQQVQQSGAKTLMNTGYKQSNKKKSQANNEVPNSANSEIMVNNKQQIKMHMVFKVFLKKLSEIVIQTSHTNINTNTNSNIRMQQIISRYLVVYLIQQIQCMLDNQNNDGVNDILNNMHKINKYMYQLCCNTANQLVQIQPLVPQMNKAFQQYIAKVVQKNGSKQGKSTLAEQQQQLMSILVRQSSSSRETRQQGHDTQAISIGSKASSYIQWGKNHFPRNYQQQGAAVGNNGLRSSIVNNGMCDDCILNKKSICQCIRTDSSLNRRSSSNSFEDVIDILHV